MFNNGNDMAVKVTSPLNSNEYYLLENRAKQGWDAYIKDEGMMVLHVTYVASRWTANTPLFSSSYRLNSIILARYLPMMSNSMFTAVPSLMAWKLVCS